MTSVVSSSTGPAAGELSVHASPPASPVLSNAHPAVGFLGAPLPTASSDAGSSRSSAVLPSSAAQQPPRTLTAAQSSLASEAASEDSSSRSSVRQLSLTSVAQRVSVSLQRSPTMAGVTRLFGARLAGSFSIDSSPAVIGKQLQLRQSQSGASVSRASRASVQRAVESTSHSLMRPHALTSPSLAPSRAAPSHLASPFPALHLASSHSRGPSTDHSQPLPSLALTVAAADADAADGCPAAAAQAGDVSRSHVDSVSRASSAASVTASSRQSEVELAAQRLRSLDQEMLQRKPSQVLHPISNRRLSLVQQQQRQQHEQRETRDDERMRGQPIRTPLTGTTTDDHTGQPSTGSTHLTPLANAADPADAAANMLDATDPAAAAAAAVAPPTGCAAVVSSIIASIIFAVVYLPFTVAILTQSVVQHRPILPVNWQTELTGRYWLFSFSLFGFLFCFPFILVFGLMADTGIWSVFDNNVRSAIPFTMCFAFYLSLFVMLHVATWYYAHIRKDLSVIHSTTRQFHFTLSTLLCTAAIIFEAFQLISPFTSIASLGLHNTTPAPGHDGAAEAKYQHWLTNMGYVFGIGQWQVQDINTFIETFWIVFGIIIVYAFALGYGIQSNMQPSHTIAPVLFELIPGTFYLSIVGRLFRIFDCSPDAVDGSYRLSGNSSMECWNNFTHRSMCMASFMGLLFYSSSAMFVACYRGDASGGQGVKFKPVYLVLERTLRDLFAMTTSLIGKQSLSRALSYPILLVLTWSTYHMQPCSIPTLTRLKVVAQASAVWLLSVSFLADMFRSVTGWFDVYVPALLVWGWVAGVGLFGLYEAWCYRRRWQRRKQRRHTIAVMGAMAAPDLQLAEDDDDAEVEVAVQEGTRDSIMATAGSRILEEAAATKLAGDIQQSAATVSIAIDQAASSADVAPRTDIVQDFTAPISTTPSSLSRPLAHLRQQAIRHTQTALTADGRRDSVSAQPNVVGRGSIVGATER